MTNDLTRDDLVNRLDEGKGPPPIVRRGTKTVSERFWAKVEKSDGCWEWRGGRQHNGYGGFYVGGERRQQRAHRVSWELHFGPIPEGLFVLHRCDNPPCVRPDHLFLGTKAENMQDCARKGRVTTIGHARLTHCKRGHAFTPENTYVDPTGARRCRTCQAGYVRRLRETGAHS